MDESTARSRHPDSLAKAFLWALLPTLLLVLTPPNATYAQVATNITPSALPACPGPCGAGVTVVTPLPPAQGGTITITGGARPGNGPNLFHSFGQFDVGPGDVANFQNTQVNGAYPATSNILSRVTGGNPSQIYGTIRTTDFPGANLFLMNPAGVLFGATAVLDLGAVSGSVVRQPGSFYATTADYLNLGDADGTSPFYADPLQTSVLSVAPVVAFGFLGPNAASIAIQGGNLEVSDSQTLSFIGGPGVFTPDTGVPVPSGVTMTAGRLSAPNGLIYMETVTEPGEIPLPTLSGSPLGIPVSFPGSENAVIYVQSGELVMKGASLLTATTGPTSGEPIDIDVEVAGQFTMKNVSALSSSTTGEGQAGAINVSASTLAMDASSITTETSGDGHAGHITANVGTLSLDNGTAINSNNFSIGSGQGGNVTIQGLQGAGSAADSVTLSNGAAITTQTSGPGRGGDILITSSAVQLDTGAGINSFTFSDFEAGAGGDISLNVGTLTLMDFALIQSLSQTFSPGFGHGGNVTIQGLPGAIAAESVEFFGGSSLVSQTFGSGDGGRVAITSKSVAMGGGAFIEASTLGTGPGGDIVVSVQQASISGGAVILSNTDFGDPLGGAGGTITVQGLDGEGLKADSLTLAQGSGIISKAFGEGRLGDIVVHAKTVSLTDGAVIQAGNERDTGRTAGNVTIDADSVGISGESRISSQVFSANAGLVLIKANALTLDNGSIETSTLGIGRGGAVVLDVGSVSLANGATINSSSSGTEADAGDAGNVTITSSGAFTSNASTIATSAENARGGDILIDAQNVQLSNGTLISASSRSPLLPDGAGNAGNITINSDSNVVMQNSKVTTEASNASGGSIEIDASDAGMVQLVNSRVSTSVGGRVGEPGASDGGNINIDPQFVILQNSQIRANAVAGAGGAIDIIATSAFIADPASIVSASSTLGISGTVNIQSPLQNVGGELTALTSEFSSAAALLAQQCAARAAGGTFSTFVVASREGLPVEPGGFLASPSLTAELLGSRLSGRDPQTQLSAVTGLFPKYDARPIQLAKLGNACR